MRNRNNEYSELHTDRRIGVFRIADGSLFSELHHKIAQECFIVRAEYRYDCQALEIDAYCWRFDPCNKLYPEAYYWYLDALGQLRAQRGDLSCPVRVNDFVYAY